MEFFDCINRLFGVVQTQLPVLRLLYILLLYSTQKRKSINLEFQTTGYERTE